MPSPRAQPSPNAMPDPGPFTGFPAATLDFLADLAAHNDRAWFLGHKAHYESVVVAPALAFAAALGRALQDFSPSVRAELAVGGSLFRVQRDVRFSHDQRPYKTHVGIRLRDRDTARSRRCTGPVYYVEFDARGIRLGAGAKEFDPPTLASYRHRLARGLGVAAFEAALTTAKALGAVVLSPRSARAPVGHRGLPCADLLRWKGLFVLQESPTPAEFDRPEFVDYCADRLRPFAPLFAELRRVALAATAPDRPSPPGQDPGRLPPGGAGRPGKISRP